MRRGIFIVILFLVNSSQLCAHRQVAVNEFGLAPVMILSQSETNMIFKRPKRAPKRSQQRVLNRCPKSVNLFVCSV
uniref:Secreted protein n=1 Tax=Panagrellus redivivus TaxID=6233 RepID=A0A7E4ULD2_PANRE